MVRYMAVVASQTCLPFVVLRYHLQAHRSQLSYHLTLVFITASMYLHMRRSFADRFKLIRQVLPCTYRLSQHFDDVLLVCVA